MPKAKEKDEEEIVMVGPGAEETEDDDRDQVDAPEVDKEEDEEDEKENERKNGKEKDGKDEEEDEVEEDARAGHGEDDEEEDKPNSRESRKARRERQKRARERSQREITFLRQRNETLEKEHNALASRVTATEATTIDQRISSLESQLAVARNVEAEAIKQQEGDEAVEARTIQGKIQGQIDRLKNAKEEISTRETRSPRVDPNLMHHAETWIQENPWYDPRGTTKDSRTVVRLDRQIIGEGYDPKSPEYWEELTKRASKALPHRFKDAPAGEDDDDGEEEKPQRKNGKETRTSGPKFSTGGRERPLAKNEVFVSADRRAAMQEAGVWDDKVLRTRYLKNYQKWDRENKNSRDRK